MNIRRSEPDPWKLSHTWTLWLEMFVVKGKLEKYKTDSEGLRVVREFLYRRNYLTNKTFDVNNWDEI